MNRVRIRQPADKTVQQVVRGNHHKSFEIVRDDSRSCTIVGDPSGFVVNLDRELARMRRYNDSSCLLMVTPDVRVDILAMDGLGARFAANLRSYDSLCRYGANHFLVLLPHVQTQDVPGIVRRLRLQVAGYSLKLANGADGLVTATTGGVMLDPECPMQTNIDRAILSCRAGLKQGGDTDQMWSPSLRAA